MKQVLVVAALFVATLAITLWALGAFDASPGTGPEGASTPPTPPGPTGSLPIVEPTEEPLPEVPTLEDPVRVLAVGTAPRSFTAWLYQLWDRVEGVRYQAWATSTADGISPVRAHKDLPELTAAPTVESLADVDVLLLDDVDPASFPPAFWERVAERVKSGRLALLLLPGITNGRRMAEEPSLKPLMPVEALPVAAVDRFSDVVAGVFAEERPFEATEEGRAHPASRLTSWSGWSRRIWEALGRGASRWGTKFCHPVGAIAPGAQVLLSVRLGADRVAPALVASGPADASGGRVLWVGFFDLGDAAIRSKGDAEFRERSYRCVRALAASWLAWLAKR